MPVWILLVVTTSWLCPEQSVQTQDEMYELEIVVSRSILLCRQKVEAC